MTQAERTNKKIKIYMITLVIILFASLGGFILTFVIGCINQGGSLSATNFGFVNMNNNAYSIIGGILFFVFMFTYRYLTELVNTHLFNIKTITLNKKKYKESARYGSLSKFVTNLGAGIIGATMVFVPIMFFGFTSSGSEGSVSVLIIHLVATAIFDILIALVTSIAGACGNYSATIYLEIKKNNKDK